MIGVKKKEDIFYDLFINAMEQIIKAGNVLDDLIKNGTDVESKVIGMKEPKVACNQETRKMIKEMKISFITPFDREDIYAIARAFDNMVNLLEEVANRFAAYNVQKMREDILPITDLIILAIKELGILIHGLRNSKKDKELIRKQIIEVNRIENEGDVAFRNALKKLFTDEKNPIELIKWQTIYQFLEDIINASKEVANVTEYMVTKEE